MRSELAGAPSSSVVAPPASDGALSTAARTLLCAWPSRRALFGRGPGRLAAVGIGRPVALHVADTVAAAGLRHPDVATRVIEMPRTRSSSSSARVVRPGRPTWCLHLEAAHRRPRVVHVAGDRGGAITARAGRGAAAEHVDVLCGWRAVSLLSTSEGVTGVLAVDARGNQTIIRAREIVLATGGIGRLFRYTTNGPYSTGDGLAMALAVGVRTAALEFVQFHPTALRVDADPLPLLTEALRGAGAHGHRGRRARDAGTSSAR